MHMVCTDALLGGTCLVGGSSSARCQHQVNGRQREAEGETRRGRGSKAEGERQRGKQQGGLAHPRRVVKKMSQAHAGGVESRKRGAHPL